MISTNVEVGTTRVQLLSPSNSWRTVYIHVIGNTPVYLGGADVTTANGLLTEKHTSPIELYIPAEEELWAVAASTVEVRLMKPLNHVD